MRAQTGCIPIEQKDTVNINSSEKLIIPLDRPTTAFDVTTIISSETELNTDSNQNMNIHEEAESKMNDTPRLVPRPISALRDAFEKQAISSVSFDEKPLTGDDADQPIELEIIGGVIDEAIEGEEQDYLSK